ILDEIKNKSILTVNLSIDEIEKNYDFVRGVPNGCEKVKKTYILLKKLKTNHKNLIIGVNIVLSKFNNTRFKKIVRYIMRELDPDSLVSEIGSKRKAIYFEEDISIPKQEYIDNLNFLLVQNTHKNNAKLTSFFRKNYYRLVKKHVNIDKEILKCYAGYASCEISCTGEIWNCAVRADSMGSLKKEEYNFFKVWESTRAYNVRKTIKDEKCFCNTANPNYTNMICNLKIL
ncbi:MAG: radical SAM protein, partial [Nanoarchaeota archaeon]